MTKDKPILSILHSLPRSGGTILSWCLGVMDKIALLSEIHPSFSQKLNRFHPLIQARDWHQLYDSKEFQVISQKLFQHSMTFSELLFDINHRLQTGQKHLLIRDFSHADFIKTIRTQPKFSSQTCEELENCFKLQRLSFVRHPLQQWQSLDNYRWSKGRTTAKDFLSGYRQFAEMASKTGFIKYEDFCQEPSKTLQSICDIYKFPYDFTYYEKQASNPHVTGDETIQDKKLIFVSLPQKPPDEIMELFDHSEDYQTSLKLLDYES